MRRAFGIAIALKTPQSEKGMIYNAGAQGEAAVSDALAKLPDTYFVVQDLQISTAHGSAQIDHLVSDLTVFSMSKLRTSAVVSLLVLASTGPRRGTLER